MGHTETLPQVRCLSCGAGPASETAAPLSLRSQSERFAFAHCPHCNCLRMMSVERNAGRSARKPRLAEASAS